MHAGRLFWSVLLAWAFAALSLDCDRGATGVDACKRIEARRCEQAVGCTETLADEDDVPACRLFYRDQCLFGMADGAAPDELATEQCLLAIDEAGSCKGAAAISECAAPPALVVGIDPAATTACQLVVSNPEHLLACSFLLAAPLPPAAGGAAGSAGMGGTGGAGGGGGAGGN